MCRQSMDQALAACLCTTVRNVIWLSAAGCPGNTLGPAGCQGLWYRVTGVQLAVVCVCVCVAVTVYICQCGDRVPSDHD